MRLGPLVATKRGVRSGFEHITFSIQICFRNPPTGTLTPTTLIFQPSEITQEHGYVYACFLFDSSELNLFPQESLRLVPWFIPHDEVSLLHARLVLSLHLVSDTSSELGRAQTHFALVSDIR